MRITVYAPDVLTPTAVHDALCLTDRPPSIDVVRTWSKYELLLAYDWALREHLAAADNPVQRRQRPSFTQPAASRSCALHGDLDQAVILRALSDPGSIVKREHWSYEPVAHWQMRAVVASLTSPHPDAT